MKTTITLPHDIWQAAKAAATNRPGDTLSIVVEAALRDYLAPLPGRYGVNDEPQFPHVQLSVPAHPQANRILFGKNGKLLPPQVTEVALTAPSDADPATSFAKATIEYVKRIDRTLVQPTEEKQLRKVALPLTKSPERKKGDGDALGKSLPLARRDPPAGAAAKGRKRGPGLRKSRKAAPTTRTVKQADSNKPFSLSRLRR